MNEVTKEIIRKIMDNKTIDIISKEMNIRKPTLKARVESLIHQGFLGEITYGGGCKLCPMNCGSDKCGSDVKMFVITEKGKKFISNS